MPNNLTRVAGSYVGMMGDDTLTSRKQTDVLIHVTDQQTDTILATISDFWDDTHTKKLDNLETFDFVTFADKPFSQHLTKRNRVIIPAEDSGYIEFIIEENAQRLDRTKAIFANASYLELKKQKVIRPQTLSSQTTQTAANFALSGTEWQPGNITYAGIRTIHVEQHTNPYSLLKQIASEFGLELNFRVEIDGNKVVGRYVDLVEKVGKWRGREVTFGKDLIGINRREKTDAIVTALVGLGPEREDGTRLEVFVEDTDALQRWGRNGRHLVEVYEPESTDQDMTESRLRTLTENELEKRINAIVEYESDVADLENVPGMENKKIRFGDTLKIKDEYFSPPLYLEARVHTQERSIKDKSRKKVILGDYIEYTEEDVKTIWKELQAAIAKKVSMSQVMEVTYDKQTIDGKDQSALDAANQYAEVQSQPGKDAKAKIDVDVGPGTIEDTVGSQLKADNAREEAKQAVEDGQVPLPPGALKPGSINVDNNPVQSDTAGVYVDNRGILVNSGNFRLIDDIAQVESIVRENANMVNDHSFEMVPRGTTMYSSARFNVDASKLGNYFWWNLGGDANFARIQSTYNTDDVRRAKFGRQAAVLLDFDTTYWWQEIELNLERGIAGPYTLSCYFAAFEETTATTTCRIALYAYDDASNYLGTVGSILVDVNPNEKYEWKRGSVTARNLPSGTTRLRIILSAWGSGMALADGVQLVPFDRPIVYEAEEGLWKTLRSMSGYTFPGLIADNLSVNEVAYFNGGVGDIYANQMRSQRADGDMYVRPFGTNNLRVYSSSGSWRNVLAADLVPQSSEKIKTNIEKMPESALELINQSVVYRYNKEGMPEKEYGLIVERETPQEIIRGEGISSYSMSSLAWRAIQELSYQVTALKTQIAELKGAN